MDRARLRRFSPLFGFLTVVLIALALYAVPPANAGQPAVGVASDGNGGGWVAYSDGAVAAFGHATNMGDMSSQKLNRPIVGIASTPDHAGYWLVASDGGVFSYGDAAFYGSTGSIALNKPVVGIASTPSGHGYWLVASDGGVFSYGDASFQGSTGSIALNKPVVSMASTSTGHGYWLVASDGGVFCFGDAAFNGSAASLPLNAPVIGISPSTDGGGYTLVARDGGVFTYGDAQFLGSLGSSGVSNIAGLVTDGQGYVLVDSNGKTYPFSHNQPPATTTTTTQPKPANLSVKSPEDYLGLGSRLVFSTVASASCPSQTLTLTNSGTTAVNVTGLSFGGPQAADFVLASGQATSFNLSPGAQKTVTVLYAPKGSTPKTATSRGATYISQATLVIASNDPANPNYAVTLGGYNTADYGSFWEPSLQEMFDTLGYHDNAGVTDKYQPNAISPYSGVQGDEVVSAYWKRANTSQPAAMYPLVHTSGKDTSYPSFGWYTKGSSSNPNYLYSFPGSGSGDNSNDGFGQNQMLLPGTTSATRTFSPSGSFGYVESSGVFSDDNLNQQPGKWHDVRWYPAKDANGNVIPNTWIVADDIGGPINNSAKNWDYQDYVFLMTNVVPDGGNDQPPANLLNQSLNSFSGSAGGVDGSGFTSAQGTVVTSAITYSNGQIHITSASDSNTSHTNALQLGVNAATPFAVKSRLVGPFDAIDAGAEQQGIYFGPDANNYIKAEVEWNSSDNSRHVTVWDEQNGSGQILQTVALPGGNANTVDLTISVNPSPQQSASYNGDPIVTVSYAVNGGANTQLYTSETAIPTSWITSNTPAGIVTSNQQGGSPFVANYANFSVTRTY